MKISPININYNSQTLAPKKQQNQNTRGSFELPNYAKTNAVHFTGLISSSKDLLFNREIKQKLQENEIELDKGNSQITTPKRMLLEKFFSDERIYKNELFKNRINEILYNVKTKEEAKLKIKGLDVYLTNSERIKTSTLAITLIHTIAKIENEHQLDLMEYVFANNEIYKDKTKGNINARHFYLSNFEYVEEGPQAELFKTVISDEKLYSNLGVNDACPHLFKDVHSYPQVEFKKKLMKKYTESEELQNSKEISSRIGWIATATKNQYRYNLYNKVLDNKDLHDKLYEFARVIDNLEYNEQYMFLDYVLSEKEIYNSSSLWNFAAMALEIESETQAEGRIKMLKKLSDKDFIAKFPTVNISDWRTKFVQSIGPLSDVDSKIAVLDKICSDERLYKNLSLVPYIENIIEATNSEDDANNFTKISDIYLNNPDLYDNPNFNNQIGGLLKEVNTDEKLYFAEKVLTDETFYKNKKFMNDFYHALINLHQTRYTKDKDKLDIFNKVINDEELLKNKNVINNLSKIMFSSQYDFHREMINKVLDDKFFYTQKAFMDNLSSVIHNIDNEFQCDFARELFKDKELIKNKKFMTNAGSIISNVSPQTKNYALMLIEEYKKGELAAEDIWYILDSYQDFTYEQVKRAHKIIGRKNLEELSTDEKITAYKFVDVYKKDNINEITTDGKKHLLKSLIALNSSLFENSDNFSELYEFFPLLPKNTEEYCSLVKNIVTSMGIETNEISSEQAKEFNNATISLGQTLSKLSDEEFNSLTIKQEYPKDQFLIDVHKLVKDLDRNERQKVYDYFGFELHHNKDGVVVDNKGTGFSITNYPANLNNGKKLSQIENEETKQIIEQLRPLVTKFSENNKIISNNKEVEIALNEIATTLPEIRPLIGKKQHKTHDFDVFKHSLKVMQKIMQNPKTENLNDSDKKILLIASLLHDCTKAEGKVDITHAKESAFDTYYISKKLDLTKDEETKLYSLVKHHEWFKETQKNKEDEALRESNFKSIAYDLHYGNLFDLAKIFTDADLKAVKNNNEYWADKNVYFLNASEKIEELIKELKKSQPLLPVTKFPSASKIKEAITTVNADGSTNIKGVYLNAEGLVVLKFNEVEEWEKIGFPKDSVSKGFTAFNGNYGEIDTGNIKFFVHGLDEKSNLRKFDAFALPDSDALLSVSYAERPESKFRFFRTQGVIVNTDAKYIHGGGETDSGSGCCKTITDFKNDYAFESGYRHSDRLFVSELIKEKLHISDKEYMELVQNNINKPISEIEPKKYQKEIIEALATINSNTRTGNRSYNEMYLSNPEVMGVFAYGSHDWKITDPIGFINKKPEYLKDYALEKDIPYVIFGD